MPFKPLIQIKPAETPKSKGPKKRGCEFCPLNTVKGLHKIKGKVRGRKIFIWAQSPGPQENRAEKELVGPSGEFLWEELGRVGIKRDMCDIQNVVRCMPADRDKHSWPVLKMRPPSKEEIKCCSIYNEEAVEKSSARLHLVFGQIAGNILLKGEFTKTKRVFFSELLNGWVVYLDHPSYFIRQGFRAGEKRQPTEALVRFREDIKRAKALYKKKSFDRFEFVKSQQNIGVTTRRMARKAYRILLRDARKGHRLIADMEEGKVNKYGKPDDRGTSVALCCGFTSRAGISYTFALAHPDSRASKECRKLNRKLVQKLMKLSWIKKAFQYGVSDVTAVQRLLDTKVRGYDYDTLLASFFADPDAKAYGLDAVSQRSYPDFMDYKDIIGPEAFTKKFKQTLQKKKKLTMGQLVDLAKKQHEVNLARLPWKKMVVYNGSDCHISKLIERDTKKVVSQPLMQIYIDSSFVMHRMERDPECKPLFDYKWHAKLSELIPRRVKKLRHILCKRAGKYAYIANKKTGEIVKKKFNPSSTDHINWLIYKKWKIKFHSDDRRDKPNTKANTLKRMAIRHSKVALVPEYRAATKMETTYLDGYYNCAELNDGHLRTNWKLTGTGTGRISSGKNKNQKDDNVINFQNIHGDPLIQCLLIAEKQWRKIYDYWKEVKAFTKENWHRFEDYYVFLGLDFSQMELRVLCQESNDKNLIKMFSSGKDPHVEVGHALTGWPREVIAKDDRRRKLIKNMQFGMIYGLQGEGLYKFCIAQGVQTTLEEVEEYHVKYFRKFRGVKRVQEEAKEFLEEHGYVENLFGFRRHINVNQQKEMGDEYEGAYWGNQALNTRIQGAAGQMLLFSIAMLQRDPDKYNLLTNPQLEIHDALYFRVKLKYLWKAMEQGKELMTEEPVRIALEEFGIKWKVPLQAKPKAGFRFGVMVEGLGSDEMPHEWDFLNEWCKTNHILNKIYRNELRQLVN